MRKMWSADEGAVENMATAHNAEIVAAVRRRTMSARLWLLVLLRFSRAEIGGFLGESEREVNKHVGQAVYGVAEEVLGTKARFLKYPNYRRAFVASVTLATRQMVPAAQKPLSTWVWLWKRVAGPLAGGARWSALRPAEAIGSVCIVVVTVLMMATFLINGTGDGSQESEDAVARSEGPPAPVESEGAVARSEGPPAPVESEGAVARSEGPPAPVESEGAVARSEGPPAPVEPEDAVARSEGPPAPVESEDAVARSEGPPAPVESEGAVARSEGPPAPVEPEDAVARSEGPPAPVESEGAVARSEGPPAPVESEGAVARRKLMEWCMKLPDVGGCLDAGEKRSRMSRSDG